MKIYELIHEAFGDANRPSGRGIPTNVPPRSAYMTDPATKADDGAFSDPMFNQFREPEVDPNESKGVVLRFHVEQNPKTGNPLVYGYWSHDYAPDFNDSKNFGTTKLLDFVYSQDTVDLVDYLVKKEHNVNILIDPSINQQFPTEVRQLSRWANSKKSLNKYQGSVNFEIANPPAQTTPVATPVTVPSSALRVPNASQLEQQLMQSIRKNPALYSKYTAAPLETRKNAMRSGIESLHRYNDVEAAIDEIDIALDKV